MQVVDLTHPLTPGPPIFAGDPAVALELARTHEADGYQVTAISLGSHSGTHLDAPRHFFADGATLDSYPADRLVRPGWVVDVRPHESPTPAGEQPVYELPGIGAELLAQRLAGVRLEPGGFLLLWTGGALLSGDTASLLLATGAGLVGTDAPGLDDEPYPLHLALLGEGVLLAENLASLDKLDPGPVMCAFLPLAIPHADGAPVRAVAWR